MTTEETKYPTIKPTINNVLLFFRNLDTNSNKNVTTKAPIIAKKEIENFSLKDVIPKALITKIPIATPKVEPEEIPNTEGPAKGFLNKVCINNPATEIPAPAIIAVIVLGILSLKIISVSELKGTNTEPNIIPKKDNPSNRISSPIIFLEIVTKPDSNSKPRKSL